MDRVLDYGLFKSAAVIITALGAFSLFRALARAHGRSMSIRHIAGPPSPSWIFGNMLELMLSEQYGDHEFDWQRKYGPVYRLKGCFGADELVISDPVALNSIVNSSNFDHSPVTANFSKLMFEGTSLINVRGEYHRRLRAALNPGFSAAGIRHYIPAMNKAAEEITQALDLDVSLPSINISPMLSTASLGIISQAAFGCTPEELGDEFVQISTRSAGMATHVDKRIIVLAGLGKHLPQWVWDAMALLPTAVLTELRRGKFLAKQVGRRIVQGKLSAAQQGLELEEDMFSQILNPEKSDPKLTEEELADNTSLFIIAGQETSATTMAFGLLALARNPEFQDSLRREIHSSGEKTEAVYNNMPLLNAFIKEVLRLYPVLPSEERIAIADPVIPLTDSITTSTGDHLSEIPVRKGQIVKLAIAAYQRMESLWGADAGEFNPYRWIHGTTYQRDAVGPYGNLMAFFGGPHVCLGWRLAVLEMQVILCELVGKFSFKLPEGDNIARICGANLLQPTLPSGEKGVRLQVARIL
ncbi:cytochrome P450 [Roridomyces roridus]|uniref:Cytochrome P450 n=1 Tax=Roridomyces roridus TaxID=1738132 RepID=A0AAD7FRM8_9AGAR|nr:cytochrome P450 [Roridomyces roridus]